MNAGQAGSFMSGSYRLLNTFIVLAEYGYRLPIGQAASLQPTVGAGAVLGWLNTADEYASWKAGDTFYVPTTASSTSV